MIKISLNPVHLKNENTDVWHTHDIHIEKTIFTGPSTSMVWLVPSVAMLDFALDTVVCKFLISFCIYLQDTEVSQYPKVNLKRSRLYQNWIKISRINKWLFYSIIEISRFNWIFLPSLKLHLHLVMYNIF